MSTFPSSLSSEMSSLAAELEAAPQAVQPREMIAPENWVWTLNWKAFMTEEDWAQASMVERSGSLDDWLDPSEDIYEN